MDRYNSKWERLIFSHGTWVTEKDEAEILDIINNISENGY